MADLRTTGQPSRDGSASSAGPSHVIAGTVRDRIDITRVTMIAGVVRQREMFEEAE